MPMDGFTLHFMVGELKKQIVSLRIDKIMMPAKDMLILALRGAGKNLRLLLSASASFARLQLTEQKYENPEQAPMVCMLFRKHLQGARILEIRQIEGDRIVHIEMECLTELGDLVQKTLVVEVMGKHSNIILVNENGNIVDALRRVGEDMSRVRMVQPGLPYESPPMQDKLNPYSMQVSDLARRLQGGLQKISRFLQDNLNGMSKVSAQHIVDSLGYEEFATMEDVNPAHFPEQLCQYFASIGKQYAPQVLVDAFASPQDFFPLPYGQYDTSLLRPYPSLSLAMDYYYSNKDIKDKIKQKSQYLAKTISNHIHRNENRLQQIYQVLEDEQTAENYKLYGELINANLYTLDGTEKGKEEIFLPNFYAEDYAPISVPLNPECSIKENALLYFKKYKKIRKAQELAIVQEVKVQEDIGFLKQLEQDMQNSKTTAELDEIKLILAMKGYIKSERKVRKTVSQSKEIRVEVDGVAILVGKNSIQNDRLTHAAKPDEIWMHVQGVPGSHVIIKSEIPSETQILEAAKLAVYFSSAREQSTVAVDYTQKKHVKKPAQSAIGFMRYHNFKTILVSLSLEERARFANL